jgi:hypothetical protein
VTVTNPEPWIDDDRAAHQKPEYAICQNSRRHRYRIHAKTKLPIVKETPEKYDFRGLEMTVVKREQTCELCTTVCETLVNPQTLAPIRTKYNHPDDYFDYKDGGPPLSTEARRVAFFQRTSPLVAKLIAERARPVPVPVPRKASTARRAPTAVATRTPTKRAPAAPPRKASPSKARRRELVGV